jgi:hypothetical protein
MRTVYLDEPSDPWSWVSSAEEHQEQLRAALVKMHAVHALIVPNNGKLSKKRMIELSPTFKAQMRRSLALRHTSPWNGGKDVPQVSVPALSVSGPGASFSSDAPSFGF